MVLNMIAIVIGALILGAGLYYFSKERDDKESRKIYGIISAIGGVILLGFLIKMLIELL